MAYFLGDIVGDNFVRRKSPKRRHLTISPKKYAIGTTWEQNCELSKLSDQLSNFRANFRTLVPTFETFVPTFVATFELSCRDNSYSRPYSHRRSFKNPPKGRLVPPKCRTVPPKCRTVPPKCRLVPTRPTNYGDPRPPAEKNNRPG